MSIPGYDVWKTTEPLSCDDVTSTDEERKERDWSELEAAARDFVKVYGVPALLRCVSRACDDQGDLPL
jgi:hypothetical protein